MSVISLNTAREPVTFDIRITQHGDGSLEVTVFDVADDPVNRLAICDVMKRAADYLYQGGDHGNP